MKKLLLVIIAITAIACKKSNDVEPEKANYLYRSASGDYIQYPKGQFKTTDTIQLDIKYLGYINKGIKAAYDKQLIGYYRYVLPSGQDTIKIGFDAGDIIYNGQHYYRTYDN